MKNILIVFLLFNSIIGKSQDNMKIIYVYDALCGWCYGFSPVMKSFHKKYKDSLDFEVISGGMITGERIGPIGEVAPYISWAYKEVEQTTGVEFGSDFLDKTLKEGSAIFTSIPPAIALSVFNNYDQQNSIQFASALQKAIYYDGIEPKNKEAYGKIAATFGMEATLFIESMNDPKYEQMAQKDFQRTAELGVSGFPTVFIQKNGMYYKIASGYCSFETMESNFMTVKNQK